MKERAHEANRIDPPMRKETLVLSGDQSVDENLRQVFVLDKTAFLASLIGKIRHQFGRKPRFVSLATRNPHDPRQ